MGGMLFSVGCSNVNNSNDTNISDNDVEANIVDINSKYSKEELIIKYKELLPEIKQAFENYGITYVEYKEMLPEMKKTYEEMLPEINQSLNNSEMTDSEIDWDGVDGIFFNDSSKENDILGANFKLYNDFGANDLIHFNAILEVDLDDAKENGFDIRGTFLETITEIINNKNDSIEINYEKINNDINNVFKEGNYSDSIKRYNYENLEISIFVSPTISYSVQIK